MSAQGQGSGFLGSMQTGDAPGEAESAPTTVLGFLG